MRLGAIGDVVFASCLLPALRQAYPNAHLAWLVEPSAAPLLQNNPYLDEVIVWEKGRWLDDLKKGRFLSLLRKIHNLRQTLKTHHFDWALDLQGLLKSHLLAYCSGAAERIGFLAKEGGNFLLTKTFAKGGEKQKIASEYRDFAEKIGLAMHPLRFGIHLDSADYEAAKKCLQSIGVNGPFVAFCPFTTRPQKHWFIDRWAILAEMLYKDLGLDIVLLGGLGDMAKANALNQQAGDRLKNLAGQTSLRQSAAIIALADAVIGVDTGMTHLAVVLGVPTIALFGSTRPYLDAENFKLEIIYKALPCSPCRRKPSCHGDYSCMRSITPDEVSMVLRKMLS